MVIRIVCITMLIANFSSAQEEIYIQPGLLKGSATISVSDMLSNTQSNYYISGFLEYYFDSKLSMRGETYFLVDGKINGDQDSGQSLLIQDGIRTFFGGNYHVTKENFDMNFGFEPGVSVLKVQEETYVCPSFLVQWGVNYYVWKYFHFFANINYIKSSIRGLSTNRNADELVFSAGLGFQIGTKKSN